MNDLKITKVTFDALIDTEGNKQDFQFQICEGYSLVKLVINEKEYHIERDNLIRLGKACIPLTYKVLKYSNQEIIEKYYK